MSSKLQTIIAQIKSSNESDGIMSEDDSNERISSILSSVDLKDDEDALIAEFGAVGFQSIRDAEAGIY